MFSSGRCIVAFGVGAFAVLLAASANAGPEPIHPLIIPVLPTASPSPSPTPPLMPHVGTLPISSKSATGALWATLEARVPQAATTFTVSTPIRPMLGMTYTFTKGPTAGGKSAVANVTAIGTNALTYAKACAAEQVPPRVDSIHGTIESGGTIVFVGGCFGTGGIAEMNGLPTGTLHLPIVHWQDDTVTATIPQMPIAYPLKVTVSIGRANGSGGGWTNSNVGTVDFWPVLDVRTLAPGAITNLACPYGDKCSNGRAQHFVITVDHGGNGSVPVTYTDYYGVTKAWPVLSYSSGNDIWHVAFPAGWSVQNVGISVSWGAATVGQVSPDGTGATITIHWSDADCSAVGCYHSDLTLNDYYEYAADYVMSVTVQGPAGTWQ